MPTVSSEQFSAHTAGKWKIQDQTPGLSDCKARADSSTQFLRLTSRFLQSETGVKRGRDPLSPLGYHRVSGQPVTPFAPGPGPLSLTAQTRSTLIVSGSVSKLDCKVLEVWPDTFFPPEPPGGSTEWMFTQGPLHMMKLGAGPTSTR